nr:MAG TPA: hypothetical protein [Caudoviricetes sp.]
MGYDGGFTKVRMKMENQEQVEKYYSEVRKKIYYAIGSDNFYKFETSAIDLPMLDNTWLQTKVLSEIQDLNNYEIDECDYTYISKSVLEKYIRVLKRVDLSFHYNVDKLSVEQLIELSDEYTNDIKLLEKLYDEFDWDNDTLLFSYSY